MNEVIETLQKWQLEANSGHNDGWAQKHYQDKINEVVSYLAEKHIYRSRRTK
jgi:hypothetical protein